MTHQRTDSPPPIEINSRGTFISWKNWKALVGVIVLMTVGSGGSSAITNWLGIGGTRVSAEQFELHKKMQETSYEYSNERIGSCEKAISLMSDTLDKVAAIQRMQVATAEARQLTQKIKNADDRETEFIRVLSLNLKRMSASIPREPCYTLECSN